MVDKAAAETLKKMVEVLRGFKFGGLRIHDFTIEGEAFGELYLDAGTSKIIWNRYLDAIEEFADDHR